MLGILITCDDTWMLTSWLNRHSPIFKQLVVIDGSLSEATKNFTYRTVQKYENTRYVRQRKMAIITDNKVRSLAMPHFEGSTHNKWIYLCHADEYLLHDPRLVVKSLPPSVSLVRMDPIEMIPNVAAFDAMNGMKDVTLHVNTSIKGYHFTEDRLFLWRNGCRWGDAHGKVIPQHCPLRPGLESRKLRYVHYKVHDFTNLTTRFVHSGLHTGLQQFHLDAMLDDSKLESISNSIQAACHDALIPCHLPLQRAFKSQESKKMDVQRNVQRKTALQALFASLYAAFTDYLSFFSAA